LGSGLYWLVTRPAADDADVLQRFSAVVLGAGLGRWWWRYSD
jgi:hypothetical protein